MPQRDTTGIGERVPRELIDADFGVVSSLVEMAEGESRRGDKKVALHLLAKAEQTLDNIRERFDRMTAAQKEAFEPRCAELGQTIERAKASYSV